MLRMNKNNEYEIDRELTWKFAIEKNAEYQDRIAELEKENRKLRFELWESQTHRWVDVKDLKNKVEHQKSALKSMEKQIKELEETLEHRDSVLSIMYDLLRSDLGDYEQLCMIDVVIDVEVWNEPQNKLREELLDRFWKRDF